MFCIYKNGAVQKILRSNRGYVEPDGTQHTKAIFGKQWSDAERAALDIYRFTDKSKEGLDEFTRMGAVSDAAPVNYEVVRTTAKVNANVLVVREILKSRVKNMRGQVAHAGIIFSTKNFATDTTTVESINLIATALLEGATFPGGTLKWDTMDTPKAPRETYNATETQFKTLRNKVAAHFIGCTDNARVHLDALDALNTHAALIAYDYSTGWPVNPDTSEPEPE